jgi:hypothetical protein
VHAGFWWEKPKERRPLGKLSRRCENNIKIISEKWDWGGGDMDWIDLAQDRDRWQALVNAVMNLLVL